MDALIEKLKTQIIEQLNLAEVKPEDIDPNAPLFGSGLGLDSIDALEESHIPCPHPCPQQDLPG